MSPPDKRPPPRPDRGPILDQQPERRDVHHPGVDGVPAPPIRRGTLPGGMSAIPQPPPLPLEHQPTKPAPNPLRYKTWRVPTPPSTVAKARRSDPPVSTEPPRSQTPVSGQPATSLPAPSQHPAEAQAAAYKRRAEDAERKLAEKEAATAKATEAPPSGEHQLLSDEAIGKFVKEVTRTVLRKVGAPTALIAMLAGGGYALKASRDKPAPPPLTASQLDERLEKFETKVVGRLDKLTSTTNEGIDLQRCLRKKVGQIGGSLLPAVDRMGSAVRVQPFDDDCPESPHRLPEPKP